MTVKFEAKKISEKPNLGGVQKLYRFDNNYGASVKRTMFSYGGDRGLWELAVVKFEGDEYDIVYDTDVTPFGDILGHLSDEEVEETLTEIAAL